MMRLIRDPEMGTSLQIGKHFHIYGQNEWKQLFQIRRCWWYTITLYKSEFEFDTIDKSYTYSWLCLGVGLRFHLDWDFEHSFIKERADEVYQEIVEEKDKKSFEDSSFFPEFAIVQVFEKFPEIKVWIESQETVGAILSDIRCVEMTEINNEVYIWVYFYTNSKVMAYAKFVKNEQGRLERVTEQR